jgi:hypothetical protein
MSEERADTTSETETPAAYTEWVEQWTKRVAQWQASGLSQAKFCRQNNIKLTTFNFWKLRVLKQHPGPTRHRKPRASAEKHPPEKQKRTRTPSRPAARFVPVVVRSDTARSEWWCEIACRNGRVLRLREKLPSATLRELVADLEATAPRPEASC